MTNLDGASIPRAAVADSRTLFRDSEGRWTPARGPGLVPRSAGASKKLTGPRARRHSDALVALLQPTNERRLRAYLSERCPLDERAGGEAPAWKRAGSSGPAAAEANRPAHLPCRAAEGAAVSERGSQDEAGDGAERAGDTAGAAAFAAEVRDMRRYFKTFVRPPPPPPPSSY